MRSRFVSVRVCMNNNKKLAHKGRMFGVKSGTDPGFPKGANPKSDGGGGALTYDLVKFA